MASKNDVGICVTIGSDRTFSDRINGSLRLVWRNGPEGDDVAFVDGSQEIKKGKSWRFQDIMLKLDTDDLNELADFLEMAGLVKVVKKL